MNASKLISNDVTKSKRKRRKEIHEKQFRKTHEVEVVLAANWNDQGARRNLNNAQQILKEQHQLKLDDMAHKVANH